MYQVFRNIYWITIRLVVNALRDGAAHYDVLIVTPFP